MKRIEATGLCHGAPLKAVLSAETLTLTWSPAKGAQEKTLPRDDVFCQLSSQGFDHLLRWWEKVTLILGIFAVMWL